MIDGTVTDRISDGPVAGAVVSFIGKSVTTDARGTFALPLGCPPANDGAHHPWSVDHPGYHPRRFPMPIPSYSTTFEVVLDPL